jgi:HPt (histidine-containing phosphotransfer) domain-containing protein
MEALRQRFRVRALEEADQLEAAMLANDMDRVEWLAHSLAGTAGLFGYHRVGAAAAALDGAFARGDPDAPMGVSALVDVIRRDLSDHS